ncbi:MAG: hypothetical protein SNJ85_13280 [Cyanobacteriota bacterium]
MPDESDRTQERACRQEVQLCQGSLILARSPPTGAVGHLYSLSITGSTSEAELGSPC